MQKFNLKKLLLLSWSMLFLLVSYTNAQDTSGPHMLWKVSSGDSVEGYLVGSVHLMKEDVYPLDEIFQMAFDESDVIGFELDFDSVQVKSQSLIPNLGFYSQGETLEDNISAETYQLFENRMDSLGLPAANFQRMEPWLVSITIPVLQLQRAGYNGQSGIDNHFYKMAKEADKERMALETAAYQFGLFDELAPELQEKYLKYSLQEADRNVEMLDEMVQVWKTGDAQKLDNMMQGEMKEISPELYQKLLVQRNQNWVPQIEELLKSSKIPMIVVGTGHLVGSDSVIAMLREKGYQIEQL